MKRRLKKTKDNISPDISDISPLWSEQNIIDEEYHPVFWDNPDYNIPDDCEI